MPAAGGRRPGKLPGEGAARAGRLMQMHQDRLFRGRGKMAGMADVFGQTADLLLERWRRAVDRLWREVLYRRQRQLSERERALAARRIRNLQRIVRKALSEYHRLELERSNPRSR